MARSRIVLGVFFVVLGVGTELIFQAVLKPVAEERGAEVRKDRPAPQGELPVAIDVRDEPDRALKSIAELVADLQKDRNEALWSTWTLGSRGWQASAAIPALIHTMKHSDPCLRLSAMSALRKIAESDADFGRRLCMLEAIPPLIEAVGDENQVMREEAINALKRIDQLLGREMTARDEGLRKAAQEALKHENHESRKEAAIALGKIGEQARSMAAPSLLFALRDREESVRQQAAVALDHFGFKWHSGIPVFDKKLEDADDFVRFWIAYLTNSHRKPLVPQLTESALKHPDGEIRHVAVELLGWLGKEVIPALRKARLEKDAVVVRILGDLDVIPGLEIAVHDTDLEIRQIAAAALRQIGGRATIAPLIQSLKDSDPIVRGQSAIALGRQGAAAVPALCAVLKEKDRDVRGAAIYALGRIGAEAKAAVPALVDLLQDDDEYIRKVAGQALKKIDPEAASKAGVR